MLNWIGHWHTVIKTTRNSNNKGKSMRFTVFTPTYNRGYIIDQLYCSLRRQTYQDFEWIVVDDGSTDDTAEQFDRIQNEEKSFPIRYVKTANGGKHRAINIGVSLAQGELFYIVDSDDYLTNDALKIIDEVERTIEHDGATKYAGVCGIKGFSSKQEIGSTFEGEFLDITSLERPQHGIEGDKAEVFYTELLKKYPFPEFDGENFVTECVVWDKIAFDGYKLRFFNKIVMICDYLPDGLSVQGEQLLLKNPRGYGLYLHQSGKYGKIFGVSKWNVYLKYYYNLRDEYSMRQIAKNLCMNPAVFWLRMLGIRLFYKLYDR